MSVAAGEPDRLADFVDRLRTAVSATPTARPAGKPWPFAEAATHLGVTVKHLRYLADSGKVAAIRLGKRKRVISDREMTRVCREGV